MKKTKLLLTIPAILTVATPLVALTSCGNKYKDLTIEFNKGEHVTGITTQGELKTNKQFLINCSFDYGWQKIDKDNTSITAGNKTLTINEDYEINNSFQIVVKADKIKDTNVVVTVNALPTVVGYTYKFAETTSFKQYEGSPCFVPGDKFKPADITFYAIKGDGKAYPVEFGTGAEQVKLTLDGQDITKTFIDPDKGLEITEDMIKTDPETSKKTISQVKLGYHVSIDDYSSTSTISAYVGYRPGFIMIVQPSDKYYAGESYQFELNGKAGAWNFAKFEIESQSAEGVAEIDEDGFLTAKAEGQVAIKATTYFDTSSSTGPTSSTITIKIEKKDP